jgi:hypothetical protein
MMSFRGFLAMASSRGEVTLATTKALDSAWETEGPAWHPTIPGRWMDPAGGIPLDGPSLRRPRRAEAGDRADGETGYRYDDQDHLAGAKAIKWLRGLDFSVQEIGRSYRRMFDALAEKGLKPLLPFREVYLKGPGMLFAETRRSISRRSRSWWSDRRVDAGYTIICRAG